MTRLLLGLCFFCFARATLSEAAQILAGPDSFQRLGMGLDSPSGQWRPSCLDGTVAAAAPNRSLNLKIYATQTADAILEDQRGFGSAQVDFWVVGAKARSEFILRNSESVSQASYIWSLEYRGASMIWDQRQLNARGLSAAKLEPEQQRKLCGDQFIQGSVLGARLYLAATLVFQSQEKYRYYKTKVSASGLGGLFKKDKKTISELREIAGDAYLSIQILQLGGQTFDLDLLAATQSSYCSMAKIENCLDRFTALHRYAFGPDGFRAHVDAQKPEQMAVLWLLGSTYQDAGHFLNPSDVPAGSDPGFVSLSDQLYQWNLSLQQRLTQTAARVWDETRTAAEREKSKIEYSVLQEQADAITSAANSCLNLENYDSCKSRIEALKTMVATP